MVLTNGKEVGTSLTYKELYQLEQKTPELANDYFKIQRKDELTELDFIRVIYIAYFVKEKNPMDYEDFLDLVPSNRATIQQAYLDLMYPKN